MDSLVQGLEGVSSYMDDILVTGNTSQQHKANLNKVLSKLAEAEQKQMHKCIFMAPSVEYLGYVIDKDGVHPTREKVKAIRDARTPTRVTESFLGMLIIIQNFCPTSPPN